MSARLEDGSGAEMRRFRRAEAPTHAARRWAAPVLAGMGVDGHAPDVLLVMSELVANAVRHGEGEITVGLRRRDDVILVEVGDQGGGRVVPRADVGPTDVGGHGLCIVDRLARTWGVAPRDRGKVVWAELDA